jgi:putative protease
MQLQETPQGLLLAGTDEDGNQATVELDGPKEVASKEDVAQQTIIGQLTKLGNTLFECSDVRIQTDKIYFLPVSRLNAARRELVERFLEVREANRPRLQAAISRNTLPFPQPRLTYTGNVLNAKAREFYQRHGVRTIEPAAESGLDLTGRLAMTTKYCLRKELGLCQGTGSKNAAEPLILRDEDGREYMLHFLCDRCGMEVYLGTKENPL